MAGRPKYQAMVQELERRTRTRFEDEPEATHLDYVAAWQAEGKTASNLALELGVSWEMIKAYLDKKWTREEVSACLSRAREAGAHRLVDKVLDIADEADEDNVQVKRLQVQAHQWVAEKWNPRELGQKQGPTVNISIGQLMLDALRQPPPPAPELGPGAIAGAIAEDAEVLSIEESTT